MNWLLLLLTPILGVLAKIIVNALKVIAAFADSRAGVKQFVAFVVSTALTFAANFGLHFVGNTLDTFTASDVTTALVAVISFALSMVFHNSSKLAARP